MRACATPRIHRQRVARHDGQSQAAISSPHCWACCERRIAITGTDQRFFGVPAHVQVAGGLTIVRGVPQPGTFTFSGAGVTLSGAENDVGNGILDANNNGHVWARLTYTDAATGVTCKGIAQGQLTNALATQSVVARCSNGALLTGTLRDTEVFPPNVAPPTWVKSVFTGELFTPN